MNTLSGFAGVAGLSARAGKGDERLRTNKPAITSIQGRVVTG
jgi:hypothetical protein